MTDTTIAPSKGAGEIAAESRTSVPAIVTYWLLAIWSCVIFGVFNLVMQGVTIDGILLALVSGLIGTQTTLLVAAVSFWVGATVGGKQANERLDQANKVSTAALTKLAGAAPPPLAGGASITAGPDVDVTVHSAPQADETPTS